MELQKVLWVIATNNRVRCLQRVLRCFLDQDYEGQLELWVYNNSEVPLNIILPELPDNRKFTYTHNFLSQEGKPFTNVGEIFNTIIHELKDKDADISSFGDDDDIYLPSHISEGVKGMEEAWNRGCLCYKPWYSYYRSKDQIVLAHNNFEPSIFSDKNYISSSQCLNTAISYHDGWILPLKDSGRYYEGGFPLHKPTLIYDWSSEIPVYKISGTGCDEEVNYEAYKSWSKDTSTNVVLPITKEKASWYYSLINGVK